MINPELLNLLRQKQSIQAVLFDLDDTLYDRGSAFRDWAGEFATERLTLPNSPWDNAVVEWLVSADANGYCPRPDFCRQLKERFPVIEESVEEFVRTFQREIVSHIQPENGADALLKQFAAGNIPFGIVTNGSTSQQMRKVKHLALDELAKFVLISEAFGRKKPHRDIFLAAAQRLGTMPEHILFVGDHPELDIIGAQQVGMKTAWMRRKRVWLEQHAKYPPDITVDSLSELIPLFTGLGIL